MLVADVVGYSRLLGEGEAGTLVELKRLFSALVRPKVAEHGGRIVKTTGDGLLPEFASAVAQVQCAIELQAAIAIHNQDRANTKRVEL